MLFIVVVYMVVSYTKFLNSKLCYIQISRIRTRSFLEPGTQDGKIMELCPIVPPNLSSKLLLILF